MLRDATTPLGINRLRLRSRERKFTGELTRRPCLPRAATGGAAVPTLRRIRRAIHIEKQLKPWGVPARGIAIRLQYFASASPTTDLSTIHASFQRKLILILDLGIPSGV